MITTESTLVRKQEFDHWVNRPIDQILLKLAAECNLRCTYCYWFKDVEVLRLAPVMSDQVANSFLVRLKEHITAHELKSIRVILHGGEPLLFGKRRLAQLIKNLRQIESETKCNILVGITTNGVLIDTQWAKLFRYFSINVTVSLDGPKLIHDKNRVTRSKRGTYDKVTAGLAILRQNKVAVSSIGVLDAPGVLEIGAQSVLDTYLAHGLTEIDLLLPDANYDAQEVPQNLPALKALFSEWYTHHSHQGLRIRFFENTLRGLLGRVSKSEGLGLGVIALMGVTSDGGLEPLDVLRINGSEEVNTQLNLRTNTLQSITQNGLWQEVIKNSVSLPSACQNCPVVSICGGGYLPHRYKSGAGYNRPSIYCEQLKEFIYWVGESISKDINQKKEA